LPLGDWYALANAGALGKPGNYTAILPEMLKKPAAMIESLGETPSHSN